MTDRHGNPQKQQESYRQQQGQQQPQSTGNQPVNRPTGNTQPPRQRPQQQPQQPPQMNPQQQPQQPPTRHPQQPQQQRSQALPQQSHQQSVVSSQTQPPAPQQQPPAQSQGTTGMPQQQFGGAQQISGQQSQPPQSMGRTARSLGGARGQQQQGMQQPQLRPVSVEQILQTEVVTVERDTPVATAVAQMESEDVGSIVVIDDDQRPVGIVTDRKVALAIEDTPNVGERQVSDLIHGETITGTKDMTVFDAISQMSEASIRRFPIVDDDGKLEGIITLDDIIVLLATELDSAADIIQDQSPRL